jgi:hypothetical protein
MVRANAAKEVKLVAPRWQSCGKDQGRAFIVGFVPRSSMPGSEYARVQCGTIKYSSIAHQQPTQLDGQF